MKNKESAFIGALLIVIILALLFAINYTDKENKELKERFDESTDTIMFLNQQLEIESELQQYTLNNQFRQDCRYRNYSYYVDDEVKGTFCCKWVNENRICMDWLTVVSETPITINPHNFLSQNATIFIESDLGFDDEFTISLKRPTKYDECEVYDYFDEIKIRCVDYD